MALRDQPYLPLYIQDFLTDEKLIECSSSATGIYIRLMCIMHKSEEYGKILLRQKYKQNDNQIENFAKMLARQMPYSFDEIKSGLGELINEGVLILNEQYLIQKRMVRDNEISLIRSEAGKKGGEKSKFAKAKSQAKQKANSEYENEYENDIKDDIKEKNIPFEKFWDLYDKKVGDKKRCKKKWDKLKLDKQQKIINVLPNWKKQFTDIQFQPYPETFLNQERWNDEIKPKKSTNQINKPPPKRLMEENYDDPKYNRTGELKPISEIIKPKNEINRENTSDS